jgi:predicted dehydrogenase
VNLTIPAAHAEVASAAIAAGKHVWNEKPLASDTAAGRALLDQAAKAGVRVGCAPDTVLGAGIQSARRLIDAGSIGTPISALTLLQGPGPESWHPDPEFLFAQGAGPLFDLGPYYLSVLATLFGPAARVAAVGRKARDTRVIGSGPRAGTEFNVEVPTYTSALAEYAGRQAATMLFSWDSPLPRSGFVEITGTDATLAVPDPNQFDGDLRVRRASDREWTVIASEGAAAGRGSGVVDMVRAIARGVPHRASGEMALHVLEMMTAIERSALSAAFEPIESVFDVPDALTAEWDPYVAGA